MSLPLPCTIDFNPLTLAKLDPHRMPKHIAIIPDGNRRWAKKKSMHIAAGHREGADNLMKTMQSARQLGIKVVTFYAFSTENWHRPHQEVDDLMTLFATYLSLRRYELLREGIRLHTIGNIQPLPRFLQTVLHEICQETKACDQIDLVLALNYGSRDELCRAFNKILADFKQGDLKDESISEATIGNYLDTAPFGDPELLIRTSGEFRLSNFLLWQLSYAEIYVAPVLWPDFSEEHLIEAIRSYQQRERRLGGG